MNHLLRRLPFVRCYVDDCLVVSDSHEEHEEHLSQFLEALRSANLRINLGKCVFGAPEVTFAGYLVSQAGFKPPQPKIQAILDFKKPEDSSQLRRFLGMLNYYRRCIPRAAAQQAPLNDLLKGGTRRAKVVWTPETDAAFQACKKSIADAAGTAFLLPSAPLALHTDASSVAIGAALNQQRADGTWSPLGFFSRKLSPAESRYSTYDRELLAAYAAVKFFRRVFTSQPFVIRTDHRPLIYAAAQSSDKASPRQQRHLDYILQHGASFEYTRGEDNVVADALSRTCTISMPTGLSAGIIGAAQTGDGELPHLLTNSRTQLHHLTIEGHGIYCALADNIVRPYLPGTLRRTAFDVVHGPAHPSGKATARLLAEKFFWPGIRKDAHRWARQCQSCQKVKVHRHNRAELHRFETPGNRFNHLHVDLIKLPPSRGYVYCLTVIDRFSRWPLAVPLPDIRAETVARALYDNWICTFGTPLTITSDQGTQFEAGLFAELAKLVGASHVHTTPYHPQANGMVERLHRTLKTALKCTPMTPWPDVLPTVLLGLRTAFKEDLQASPAEMLFGTSLRIPGEFFITQDQPADQAAFVRGLRELFRAIKPVPAANHAGHRPFTFKDLATCTHVFCRLEKIRGPLEQPYTGPHRVIRRANDKVFVLDFDGIEKTISTDCLKPAYLETAEPPEKRATSPPEAADGNLEPPASPVLPPEPALQPRRKKKVTFTSLPASVTGEGVPVAPELPRARGRQERRKQRLIPRPLFAVATA